MSNVVSFVPASARPRPTEASLGQLRRAAALRHARDTRARFSTEDQERVAQQFHRLLEDLKIHRGLSKTEVAQKAGLGGNKLTDSSKRLDTYTLPENANPARRARIAQKPGRYFSFATAIADLLKEPEEPFLCQIFEGCSFGSLAEELPDWDTERWVVLARQVTLMARSVIYDTGLQEYWKAVSMLDVPFDVRKGLFEAAWGSSDNFALRQGLASNAICSDEIPPVPSCFIARRLMVEPQPGILVLKDGRKLPLKFRFWLEIRLALAPINDIAEVGPLIEYRTVLDAVDENQNVLTFDNPHTGGFDVVHEVLINGEPHGVSAMPDLEESEPERRYGTEHSYFAWDEVSPALLREVLSGREHRFETSLRLSDRLFDRRPPVRFEQGSPAAIFQMELLDGALEQELKQACFRLKEKFDLYRRGTYDRILAVEAAASARWQRPAAEHTFSQSNESKS